MSNDEMITRLESVVAELDERRKRLLACKRDLPYSSQTLSILATTTYIENAISRIKQIDEA